MSDGGRIIQALAVNDAIRDLARLADAAERIAAALEAANEREARSDATFQALGAALAPTGEAESLQERLIAERQRDRSQG